MFSCFGFNKDSNAFFAGDVFFRLLILLRFLKAVVLDTDGLGGWTTSGDRETKKTQQEREESEIFHRGYDGHGWTQKGFSEGKKQKCGLKLFGINRLFVADTADGTPQQEFNGIGHELD